MRQLVYTIFITNNHVLLHFCERKTYENTKTFQNIMITFLGFRISTHGLERFFFFNRKYLVLDFSCKSN